MLSKKYVAYHDQSLSVPTTFIAKYLDLYLGGRIQLC